MFVLFVLSGLCVLSVPFCPFRSFWSGGLLCYWSLCPADVSVLLVWLVSLSPLLLFSFSCDFLFCLCVCMSFSVFLVCFRFLCLSCFLLLCCPVCPSCLCGGFVLSLSPFCSSGVFWSLCPDCLFVSCLPFLWCSFCAACPYVFFLGFSFVSPFYPALSGCSGCLVLFCLSFSGFCLGLCVLFVSCCSSCFLLSACPFCSGCCCCVCSCPFTLSKICCYLLPLSLLLPLVIGGVWSSWLLLSSWPFPNFCLLFSFLLLSLLLCYSSLLVALRATCNKGGPSPACLDGLSRNDLQK